MAKPKMHDNEVETSVGLVRRLLQSQFPQWAELPIQLVESFGTDHDIYRLGESLAARLPRIEWATAQAEKETVWLPKLAPHLPLAIPAPVAMGQAGFGYPFNWSISRWLPGADLNHADIDLVQAADDLAQFVTALRGVDVTGAPTRAPGGRGSPLDELDDVVRQSLSELDDRIGVAAATESWQQSLAASPWHHDEVWVHGDLLPGNLLAVDGRLSAVIDFGGLNVGDPACDLLAAWNVFEGASRNRYRHELGVDDDSWLRGRGWALAQAVMAMPYYWDTNEGMVQQASRAIEGILAEATER
ncbi:MAG: aminoglycoside phosphotransferase family protein [Acidimicrobiia bacterium]|nr:aminoglycoside phosphotransferase family protein [Acidimicrobiia bacterium]